MVPCESEIAIVREPNSPNVISLEDFMWIRSATLVFMIGCVAADPADDPVATVAQGSMGFHCLNHTSIHVVTCEGSISLFPITITIDSLRILSDNEISILSDDLNDVSILDGGILDGNKILDDVEATVLDTFLESFQILVTRTGIVACTVVAGTQICK
jgi:hypothetical protein